MSKSSFISRYAYRPLTKDRLSQGSRANELRAFWYQVKFDLYLALKGGWAKGPIIFSGLIWYVVTIVTINSLATRSILGIDYWGAFADSIATFMVPREGPGGILVGIALAVLASGLVADDNRSRALVLYHTKLKTRTYVLSKVTATISIVFISMGVWSLLLYIVVIYKTAPPLDETFAHLWFLSSMFWVFVAYCMSLGGIALFFSSITDRALVAGVLTIVVPLLFQFIGTVLLYDITGISWFFAFGPFNAVYIIWDLVWPTDAEIAKYYKEAIVALLFYASAGMIALLRASTKES